MTGEEEREEEGDRCLLSTVRTHRALERSVLTDSLCQSLIAGSLSAVCLGPTKVEANVCAHTSLRGWVLSWSVESCDFSKFQARLEVMPYAHPCRVELKGCCGYFENDLLGA